VPTYQYACTSAACGHTFEQFQSFSEDSLTVCPACDGRLRKVFNAVGVVFKGSGFYRTDSRSGEPTEAAGSTAPSEAGTGSSAQGSSTPGKPSPTPTKSAGSAGSTRSSESTGSTGSAGSTAAPAGAGAA
jgi:putative FmdB family regulatory protein